MLTARGVEALKPKEKLYRVSDGSVKGLCIEVTPNGSKLWRLRFRLNGKASMVALGAYPEISLSKARELALDARRAVGAGVSPGLKKGPDRAQMLFLELVDEWIEHQKARNLVGKTMSGYERNRRYLQPFFGSTPAAEVTPMQLCAACRQISEEHTPRIAHNVLTFVGQVMRYGIPEGIVKTDPTFGVRGAIPPLPPAKGRLALTRPDEIRELLNFIDGYNRVVMRCYLQLMALFWCRAKELAHAEWADIDWEQKLYRIPAERMKMRNDHLVPLSRQALEILRLLEAVNPGSRYVFPGAGSKTKPMNPRSPLEALDLEFKGRMHVHGFRSMASTILNERGWNPDVIEAQLAHQDANAVRRAYNRAQYLEDRRRMMQEWADYLDELRAKN